MRQEFFICTQFKKKMSDQYSFENQVEVKFTFMIIDNHKIVSSKVHFSVVMWMIYTFE